MTVHYRIPKQANGATGAYCGRFKSAKILTEDLAKVTCKGCLKAIKTHPSRVPGAPAQGASK